MSETTNTKNGRGMGVAALVLGIIAAILSFVPCVNIFAVLPGLLSIIFGGVGMSQAKKAGTPRGLPTAGLILGILSIVISITVYFVVAANAKSQIDKVLENSEYNDALKELEDAMEDLENLDY